MQILSGRQAKPRKTMLYGLHGVGKSSWANDAPSPIFLDIEESLNDIDVNAKTEVLKTYDAVVNAMSFVLNHGEDFKTVIVDTVDWLEVLIHRQVAQEFGKPSIAKIPYGDGYKAAATKWQFLLDGFDALRAKGKAIILLAHPKIKRFSPPGVDSYDRYEPDLHDTISNFIQEWCDDVLFASFKVFTRVEEQGFGKTRNIAVGGKERYVQTVETAGAIAKNRLRLADEIPMVWSEYAKHLPPPQKVIAPAQSGNINGVVANGSSKAAVA